jgi:hypothetical protein
MEKSILSKIKSLFNNNEKQKAKEELDKKLLDEYYMDYVKEMDKFITRGRINPSLVTTSKIVEGSVTTSKLTDVHHHLQYPSLITKEKEQILATIEKMENENLDKLIGNFLNS